MEIKQVTSIGLLLLASSLHAHERILPRETLIREGYLPVTISKVGFRSHNTLAQHSLVWPVSFEDSRHSLGNNMVQFQSYDGDKPYFHGGDDLRTKAGQPILSPVDGTLTGGHYSYNTNDNGSLTKLMLPWPQQGDAYYFEISVTNPDGYRFEFHHIDRAQLPLEIKTLLDHGGGNIQKGTLLGQVIAWPELGLDGEAYNHTHYNIYDPSGVALNPEFYSLPLPDSRTLEIQHVIALYSDGTSKEVSPNQTLNTVPSEFIVQSLASLGDDVYPHTPSFASIKLSSGASTTWDFRQKLALADNSFPSIWTVFKDQISLDNGSLLQSQGDYQSASFLFRLKMPVGPNAGDFEIDVGDQDSLTSFHAKIAGDESPLFGSFAKGRSTSLAQTYR